MTASTPTIVWPKAKPQGGNTAPPISRKLDQRFTDHRPAHQRKTQFYIASTYHQEASKSLLSSCIRADRVENTITEK